MTKPEVVVEKWGHKKCLYWVVIKVGRAEFDSRYVRYTNKSGAVRRAKAIAASFDPPLKVRVEE